ncbi:MAG: sigma 54-dependent Fis family transcriptional regulator [Labilithrix sp.]|nr:sigma 54-dependent Fis family transcriptional regulator [Labilithrix sp.]
MTKDIATVAGGGPSILPDVAAFRLVVVEGPDEGAVFELEVNGPRVLVGQSAVCHVRLNDLEVSRRHASLEASPLGLRIQDLDSTNGLWVDRVHVFEALLTGEELVRLGRTQLQVEPVLGPATPMPAASSFGHVLGVSERMRRLYPIFARLAASDVPVIIEGETGTGKEVVAEALHANGPRASGPFVVFDCTAVPPSLVESELFGHEKGAFTGALTTRKGVLEQADGGTLLIDELGDLDLALQPKLLRAIERLEIRRLGGDRAIRVNVRVLAATRRDLDREVLAGRFRDDLYHRLAVARVELPPLRERRGDIELLAGHFWSEMGGEERLMPLALLQGWENEPWSGNVRELRNAVARAIALGDLHDDRRPRRSVDPGPPAGVSSDNDTVERLLSLRAPFIETRERLLEDFERRYVERLFAEASGDLERASVIAGIGKRYLQKLRAKHRG